MKTTSTERKTVSRDDGAGSSSWDFTSDPVPEEAYEDHGYDIEEEITDLLESKRLAAKAGPLIRREYTRYKEPEEAEAALANYLRFWFRDDLAAVKDSLAFIAKRWSDDRRWKKSDAFLAFLLGPSCRPDTLRDRKIRADGPQPDVSYVTHDNVMVALEKEYPATIQEITDSDEVDRSYHQTRRALNEMVEEGYAEKEKVGRSYLYFPV